MLINIIKQLTCYKNFKNVSCTYLILANCPQSFQNSSVTETDLSTDHEITSTNSTMFTDGTDFFFLKFKNINE